LAWGREWVHLGGLNTLIFEVSQFFFVRDLQQLAQRSQILPALGAMVRIIWNLNMATFTLHFYSYPRDLAKL
jgi:hypothetical protein